MKHVKLLDNTRCHFRNCLTQTHSTIPLLHTVNLPIMHSLFPPFPSLSLPLHSSVTFTICLCLLLHNIAMSAMSACLTFLTKYGHDSLNVCNNISLSLCMYLITKYVLQSTFTNWLSLQHLQVFNIQ